jgi:PhnB protein
MEVVPYLFFEGCCEQAIEFYKAELGAEVLMLMRYREAPPHDGPSHLPPGSENKIMHASLKIGATAVDASDGMCTGHQNFQGFSLALRAPDIATAERMFGALAEGGQVRQPMVETFFSPRFGMVADKFGLGWIVLVHVEPGK